MKTDCFSKMYILKIQSCIFYVINILHTKGEFAALPHEQWLFSGFVNAGKPNREVI